MSRVPAPAYESKLTHDLGTLEASIADAAPRSFWLDDVERPVIGAPLRGSDSADLVVVGGGYCGLWTALLAKEANPDHDVVVLEAHEVGWAASGRNGGFAEATLTHGEENGRRYFSRDLDQIEQLGHENYTAFLSDLKRWGVDAELELDGMLTVATEPHQVALLRDSTGAGASFHEGADLAKLVSSPVYRAGLLETHGVALVHPAKLVLGLAEVCRRLGVRIMEHSPVRSLRRVGDSVMVTTRQGDVQARQVALATNGFPSLLARNRLKTVPVYDYALMTQPLTDAQLESIGWTGRFGITDSSRQFHYYRKTRDNRILWGGYDAVYHAGGRVRAEYDQRHDTFLRLADHFFTTFPQLDDVRFTHKWGGMIDMSSRLVAFHGTALGGRVAYTSGFTGLGVVATRFGASVMLDLLAGADTPRTRSSLVTSSPLPIPPEPFAFPAVQVVRNRVAASDRNGGRDGLILRVANLLGYSFDS